MMSYLRKLIYLEYIIQTYTGLFPFNVGTDPSNWEVKILTLHLSTVFEQCTFFKHKNKITIIKEIIRLF